MLGTNDDPDNRDYFGVFWGSSVESVVLPSTLKRIEHGAFCFCKELKSISLPERLEFIGRNCFNQSGLEFIELPSSLRTILRSAFAECKRLKTVKFDEGLEVLGADDKEPQSGVFQESAVEDVRLPHTLKRIEHNVFNNCKNLRSITLPDFLEYIGNSCFWGSGLADVQIPKNCVQADESAFGCCSAQSSLVFRDGRVFSKDQ